MSNQELENNDANVDAAIVIQRWWTNTQPTHDGLRKRLETVPLFIDYYSY